MAAMATTPVLPFSSSFPLCRSAVASAAGFPRSSKLSSRKFAKFSSAFFGDSFDSQFAFCGPRTRRVSEEKTKRKLVGVVQAKRMASSESVTTRAPDFQVRGGV